MNGQVLVRTRCSSLSACSRKLESNIVDDRWPNIAITRQIVWLPGGSRGCNARNSLASDIVDWDESGRYRFASERHFNQIFGQDRVADRLVSLVFSATNVRCRLKYSRLGSGYSRSGKLFKATMALLIFESLEFD